MKNKSKGFSLVETLSSTAILVTVVAGLATLFSQVKKEGQMMDRLRDVNMLHLKISNLLTQSRACNNTLFNVYAGNTINNAENRLDVGVSLNTGPNAANLGAAGQTEIQFIFDARNAGQVAYRVGSGATTNDQAARGIVIASMIISNFGINSGTVAPGQRFFFLNITYRITADKVFGFANDYRITKSIPIYLMWGDDTATVDATETFLGCTSNAHRGLNRAFMNVDIPDLAVDNTDYDGGMYPGFTPAAGGHPPVAPVIGPSNTTDLTPGFIARNDFLVYADTGANANVSGFVQAREFFSLSDESEKVKIQTLPNALELLSKINVYEYNLKGENRKEIGFLAQEMEKLSPLVSSRPDGVKSMSYSGVIALQVEAIKELKKKQDTIKLEMQNLKNELLEIQKSR